MHINMIQKFYRNCCRLKIEYNKNCRKFNVIYVITKKLMYKMVTQI